MPRSVLAVSLCLSIASTLPADDGVNTPVRIAELQGEWQLEVKPSEYQQVLVLSPGGRGTWYQNVQTLPFSFAWFVEELELVLFFYESRPNLPWKVGQKRFAYQLDANQAPPRRASRASAANNVLTIKDGDKTLVFHRGTRQVAFDPNRAGLQVQLSNDKAVATTVAILDAAGRKVLLIPHLIDLGTYRQGAYWEFPPGRYVVMAGSEGKPLVQETVTLVADRETPLQVYFEGNRSRVTIGEPRDKHGNRFDDDAP